ncbi:MAG: hypothetical protein WBD40_25195 [Tepidisphaeraceae bacterium]
MNGPADADSPSNSPDLDLYCPNCGYSLRGLESDNCPECGLKVDRSAASVSRIPWEHRRRIGRVRAYWRTLTMSKAQLADDVMRPVRYRDARSFQFITVLIAGLPLIALAAWPLPPSFFKMAGTPFGTQFPMALPPGYAIDIGLPLLVGVGLHVLPVAIVLFLLAMTGVASYFFHPPHLTVVQQNRAVALSYYACSSLVLLLLPGLTLAAFLAIESSISNFRSRYFFASAAMVITMICVPLITLFALWFGYLRMLRRVTQCSATRVIAMAVTLPIAWAALAALILIGLPWLVGFAMIVKWSFS